MRVLGISAFYHDSAAALVEDGKIISAAQEERFTRRKHDSRFPSNAISYCLESSNIDLNDIDFVTFYDKPFLKFERLLETYIAFSPKGFRSFSMALPIWLNEKLFQKYLIKRKLKSHAPDYDWEKKLLFSEHHLSHAASAFYPSPFKEAAILTLDGVGEWTTTSIGIGDGNDIKMYKEIHFPHSLGLLYSAFTYYTGFKVNSGEYKVMGLAPYGTPKYRDIILNNLIDLNEDGSFRLNLKYFDYCTGLRMTNNKFNKLFDSPPRSPGSPVTQREMDLAASIQSVTEEIILRMSRSIAKDTGLSKLCLAGGVALNCVANGKILEEKIFEEVWIQPAAGDSGGALGAALSGYYQYSGDKREKNSNTDSMQGSYLGPEYTQTEIENELERIGAKFNVYNDHDFLTDVTNALCQGKAVGWFQGRMEFGPRALGSRSILGDPRSPDMQRTLNKKIKYRESFRPFAPAIKSEEVQNWFDLNTQSPYMLFVSTVKSEHLYDTSSSDNSLSGIDRLNIPRSKIPAVTHVDNSARIQTVDKSTNKRFYDLLSMFENKTSCPILVNTSFNVRGEPIVCSPEDAFRCFMGTEMDVLAIGNCILTKTSQDLSLKINYKNNFELD